MKLFSAIFFAAAFTVGVLPDGDAPLEPSLQNEVDAALSRAQRWLAAAPTNAPVAFPAFATNGMSRAERAVYFVSAQKGPGYWVTDTNAAPTRAACAALVEL